VIEVVGPVLAASLLGSPHCAGMCGAFAVIANGTTHQRRNAALYHLARLGGYAVLGVLAGWLGTGIDRLGSLAGVARAAAIVAGSVMLLWGLATILTTLGVRLPRLVRPGAGGAFLGLAPRITALPEGLRAGALGLLSMLLPCGWLWVFVAMATAAGGPLAGAGLMAVFWVGTVPALVLLGVAVQRGAGPLRRYLPLLAGAALIVVGLMTVMRRGAVHHRHGDAPAAADITAPDVRHGR
jgi:uncharacterized protein